MNCKPGDLAVIVSGSEARNLGIIVRVGRVWAPGPHGGKFKAIPFKGNVPAWIVRSEGRPMLALYAGKEVLFYERPLADASLRPIRDPGDDAVDETLINNPVRHEVTA